MDKTSTTSDGTKIIYSDAHQALEAYNAAIYRIEGATEALAEAKAAEKEAKETLRTATAGLCDALQAHYGHLPEALSDHGGTLIFETDDDGAVTIRKIVKPASICDLYRCERPAEPAPLDHEPEAV